MFPLPLNYPLKLKFKFRLSPQFSLVDANGTMIGWAAQKLFRLKESVTVFSDSSRRETLYSINADRIMDFGARYHFTDATGKPFGAVQRVGLKSLWRANYNIQDATASPGAGREPGATAMTIREENPWIKVIDGALEIIPFAELVTGYILHPAYNVMRSDGRVVMRIQKQAAFFESRFLVEKKGSLDPLEVQRVLLSLIMLVLLERDRG